MSIALTVHVCATDLSPLGINLMSYFPFPLTISIIPAGLHLALLYYYMQDTICNKEHVSPAVLQHIFFIPSELFTLESE